MNWVDLVVILSAAGSAAFGVVRGGTMQLVSYVGFAAGLLLGAGLAAGFGGLFQSSAARTAASLTLSFGLAIVLSAVGRKLGKRLVESIHAGGGRQADAVAGAAFGVVITLVGTWLVAGMLGPIGLPHVSPAIQQSAIVRALEATLPPAPLALSRVQRLLIREGIPPMLAELEPSPAPDVPTATDAEVAAAVKAARAGTVQIVSEGCGRVSRGSGFVAAPGVVVTNAHVVAGVDKPVVNEPAGSRRSIVVAFDPDTDLAVLRVTRLSAKPLPLLSGTLERGVRGAVLGYPGGGPFSSQPAAVLEKFDNLVGRTIYGGPPTVSRQVFQLKARIRGGNSGGPFVTTKGEVAGVVFSSSAINENIGYALTIQGVAAEISRAVALTSAVSTGDCPTGSLTE